MPRLAKPFLVLVAFAALALAVSACAVFKPGSLQLSQPAGIGAVHVHFALCGDPTEGAKECAGLPIEGQTQYILGISLPKGVAPPATITAVPVAGGAAINYRRNDQVSQEIAEVSSGSWPPAGSDGFGYLSDVFTEEEEPREWTVDIDFGLPPSADGGPSGAPFGTAIAYGGRRVGEGAPADRRVECFNPDSEEDLTEEHALCALAEEKSTGVSDLKIQAPPLTSVYIGGQAQIAFPLSFAGSASPLPAFGLTAVSNLPQAQLALASPTFTPPLPDAASFRSPIVPGTVAITVPKGAKPGVYDVTLAAATPQGGSVAQVAKLRVTKPKIKFGKVKLNRAKGTAILFVKVPAPGTLTVFGKGLSKAKRITKAAKTVKVPVKPKGKTKAKLAEVGRARVKAKISFQPTGAAPVVKAKGLTLKKNLGA